MLNVQEIGSKIKALPRATKERAYLALVILLVALLAFGLGRLSVLYGTGSDFRIEYPPHVTGGGEYVGSKTGHYYFFPWCASAGSIPDGMKVYFQNPDEAKAAGYAAGNCNGMR